MSGVDATVAETVSRLVGTFAGLPRDDVAADATLDDLRFDSLDRIELAMALEDQWPITVSDAEAGALEDVAGVVLLVEAKLGEGR